MWSIPALECCDACVDGNIDHADAETAVEWVSLAMSRYIKHSYRPLEELGVDLSTSAGYPMKRKYANKGEYYAAVDWRTIYERVDREDWLDVWDVFPKHEILKFEKAVEKVRIICGSPADLFAMGAELYREGDESMSANTFKGGSAIGLNPFSGGWNSLAMGLGSRVDEADCKQWDSRMHSYWWGLVYRVHWNLMPSEMRTDTIWRRHLYYLRSLQEGLMHSPSGDIHYRFGGHPSGSARTCHDNTMGHMILTAYCFIRGGADYVQWVNWFKALMGDDFISSTLTNEVPEFWEFYREFGVNLPEVKRDIPLTQSSFLSNGFLHTRWGWMPRPVPERGLFSFYSGDTKEIYTMGEQRCIGLWLVYFWTPARQIMRAAAEERGYFIPPDWAGIACWTGLISANTLCRLPRESPQWGDLWIRFRRRKVNGRK